MKILNKKRRRLAKLRLWKMQCRLQGGNHFCLLPKFIGTRWVWLKWVWKSWYQVHDMGSYCYSIDEPTDGYGWWE